jgi:6-phosphogluconolactonase
MQELRSRTALKRLTWMVSLAALLMCAVLPGMALAKHKKKPGIVGAMYSETNGDPGNKLLVFDRYSDGKLKLRQTVGAGGNGGQQPEPGCDPPDHRCPLIDAQNEVVTSPNGKWVFAVNAGSNTIATFDVHGRRVKRVGVTNSQGEFPNSIAVHKNVLYVLNTNSKNIAGYKVSSKGKLSPIAGSVQSLTNEVAPLSRQIGFDNTGKLLFVSLLTEGAFDSFQVNSAGVAGPATLRPSASPEPFAFAFDPRNNLIANEVVNDMDFNQSSNGSSYDVGSDGSLTAISTVPTQGYASCWVVITKNGKQVFMVNTGGPSPFGATVTTFANSPSGQLTFKSVTPKKDEFTLTDEALSRDDKYLYVVSPLTTNPFTNPPPTTLGSKIVTFKVGKSGLKRIGETNEQFAPGMSGLTGN